MDIVEQNYYELALNLFEQCRYADAVENFIKSYQCGYMQQEIIQILYDCFITPNEVEFRENYEENKRELTGMAYDKTAIDFIPVSDTEYYLWHKQERKFHGLFRLDGQSKSVDENEFESLLIADIWDIRLVIENLMNYNWNKVYLVLNEQKEAFFSFLKLPGFREIYLQNVVCFDSLKEMESFFLENSDCYIPKKIVTLQQKKESYIEYLYMLHEQRVKDMQTPRNNVYLSICIPSYNRGHIALKSVRNILGCEYDSEIEVVVSDNGSTKNIEGYQELSDIQDSRIHYVRVDENQGYASNVCNVLKHAKGKFMLLCSDEDTIILQELGKFLKFLKNHACAGAVLVSGIGPNLAPRDFLMAETVCESIKMAVNKNYLSGLTINGEIFRKYDVPEQFEKMRGNVFVETYTHAALAMLVCKNGYYVESGINLIFSWTDAEDQADVDKTKDDLDEPPILPYMRPEARIEQLNATIEFAHHIITWSLNEFIVFFVSCICKAYYLVNIVYVERSQRFEREYSWEDACSMIHENDKLLMERYGMEFLQEELELLYQKWRYYTNENNWMVY